MDYILMICFVFCNVYKLLLCQLNLILYFPSTYLQHFSCYSHALVVWQFFSLASSLGFSMLFVLVWFGLILLWLRFFCCCSCCLKIVLFCFVFFKNKHKSYMMPNQQGTSVVSQKYPTCWKIKMPCSFPSICIWLFKQNLTGHIIQACLGYFCKF